MICGRMIAQGKSHIATGSSIFECGSDADSEDRRVVWVGTTGRVVVCQRHWGTADIAGAVLEGGGCAWEYSGEGGDGGQVENAACLNGGLMYSGVMGGRICQVWVAEDMLRVEVCRSGEGKREKEKRGGGHYGRIPIEYPSMILDAVPSIDDAAVAGRGGMHFLASR